VRGQGLISQAESPWVIEKLEYTKQFVEPESIRASKVSGMSGEQREICSEFPLVKPSAPSFNNGAQVGSMRSTS